MVDLIYFNKPVGGIKSAEAILKQFVMGKKCDIKKLVEYAARFPNIKMRKRIGLILEELDLAQAMLKPLVNSVKKTAVSTFTGSRKGTLNKKWRVIVNDS